MIANTISTFLIGFSTAFFTIFAIHILAFRKNCTRFQKIIGIIMSIWAVWDLKDIVISFPEMYNENILDWIILIDGWSAITYTIFVFEATKPKWATTKRIFIQCIPFALFTLAYILWHSHTIITAYAIFLWFYAWSVIIIAYIETKRYLKYIRNNFSNIENIDISWFKPLLYFAIASQLSWLFTSLSYNIWVDIIYYVSTIILWLAVLHFTWDFHPITIEQEEETEQTEQQKDQPAQEYHFAGKLEQIVEVQKLYLKQNLTINDLATSINSNRTYVSNYIGQVLGLSFYDYINKLRIEKQSIPMIKEHPEFTFEYIAQKSGFSSISTFRRAFVKHTGMTPSQYSQNYSTE